MAAESGIEIRRGDANHLGAIRNLLQRSRHLHIDLGDEDLTGLLQEQIALLGQGVEDSHHIPPFQAIAPVQKSTRDGLWGFLGIQAEKRPTTLPATAPTKAYVRCAALMQGHSPVVRIGQLMAAAERALSERQTAYQLVAYNGAHWLIKPLESAGFTIAERVQFWELTRLDKRDLPSLQARSDLLIRSVQLNEIDAVAKLDAATFPPLWHLGASDIYELALRSRLQVAVAGTEIVGYSGLMFNTANEAQLARLAVAPTMQKQGVGHQLLTDALLHAKMKQVTLVTLNTQTTNGRAQALYRAYGFQPASKIIPVLTKMIN